MLKYTLIALIAFMVSGCAGLDISSLDTSKAHDAHKEGKVLRGYIVYHPMIVVEIQEKVICTEINENKTCSKAKIICQVGEPKLMPDYSKPYLVRSRSGLGKVGVDVKIQDGWRLDGIRDESDNSGLLGVLASAGGMNTYVSANDSSGCAKSGLYQLTFESGSGMKMTPLIQYKP